MKELSAESALEVSVVYNLGRQKKACSVRPAVITLALQANGDLCAHLHPGPPLSHKTIGSLAGSDLDSKW